jgi:hypothetical protein
VRLVLAATARLTAPLPLPLPPETILIQVALPFTVAVHPQLDGEVTFMLAFPPAEAKDWLVGEIAVGLETVV